MRFKSSALAVLLGISIPAEALTLKEAQTLPLPQLAHTVLGDFGAMMVDVDRPPHKLMFYQRATAPAVGFRSWTGMCESMVVEPSYDQHWTPTQFSIRHRYGAPHGMHTTSITDWDKASSETQISCEQSRDVRKFFEAAESQSAFRALVGLQIFKNAAQSESPLPFVFSCSGYYFPQACNSKIYAEELAKGLDFYKIRQVTAVNCEKAYDDRNVAPYARRVCYMVNLDSPGEYYFIEMDTTDRNDNIGTDEKFVFIRYSQSQVLY